MTEEPTKTEEGPYQDAGAAFYVDPCDISVCSAPDGVSDPSEQLVEMTRTAAKVRLDQVFAERRACYIEGRCPRCEALWPSLREWSAGDLIYAPFEHQTWCPFTDDICDEVARLVNQFGVTCAEVVRETCQPGIVFVDYVSEGESRA